MQVANESLPAAESDIASPEVVFEEPSKVSLQELPEELVVDIRDVHCAIVMPPSPSCCSSVGENLLSHEIFSSSEDSGSYCTCEHKYVEVSSAIEADDDLLIFCCGQYRSLIERCVDCHLCHG
jgi:hypothetical protein